MANNYQQSAFVIVIKSPEEKDYLQKLHDRALEIARDGVELDEKLDPFEQAVADDLHWGWDVTIVEEKRHTYCHFSTSEGANTDAVVVGLQEFLRRFRPGEYILITWAYTCDKPRADEFSGGGVVFTANDARWVDVSRELELRLKDLK